MTQPQTAFLEWLAGHNGRCVMARYDKPMFGDYGPTIRRLMRRGMIARTCSPNGFPFLHLTEIGRRAVSIASLNHKADQPLTDVPDSSGVRALEEK
jgi:hypothetical protein